METTQEISSEKGQQGTDDKEIIREIKRSLRGVMSGPTSQSMREKGLGYKVNFGVELPRLREMSASFPHTYSLAAALWKENIRECRLLAAMLMPVEEFDGKLADLWVEQMHYTEEAECTTLHLFSRMPDASDRTFRWIARNEPVFRLCGWLLLGRLLWQGAVPNERDARELLDHARAELLEGDSPAARAAYKALLRYGETGNEASQQVDRLLEACGL